MKSLKEIIIENNKWNNYNFSDLDYVRSVSIDTRSVQSGDLFIGIIGDNFDGNQFLSDAIKKGACCVVLDRRSKYVENLTISTPYVVVDNSIEFLQELSKKYLQSWKNDHNGEVVCITGSNGKTTTKEMLSFLLEGFYPNQVLATKGNFNNHIGVPLTLLRLSEKHRYAVVEIGTSSPGEIESLSKMAMPDYGIITSVGESHLEKLKSIDGVFKEKVSLFEYVDKHSAKDRNCYFYKLGKLEDLRSSSKFCSIDAGDSLIKNMSNSFILLMNNQEVELTNNFLVGDYNFYNLSLAAAMALRLGVSVKSLNKTIPFFKPGLSRSEWIRFNNMSVFCDYYNANPASMTNAIDAFYNHCGGANNSSLYILGDMYELGDDSEKYHEQIGRYLKSKKIRNVIFIGNYSHCYQQGYGENCIKYKSSKELKLSILVTKKYEHVFVKGSRGVKLEEIFVDD